MRLSRELVKQVAGSIIASVEAKGMVKFVQPSAAVAARIADIVIANLQEEDKLDRDVERLLQAHEREIARGAMDYRKMFELTKQKLAKDRKIVL